MRRTAVGGIRMRRLLLPAVLVLAGCGAGERDEAFIRAAALTGGDPHAGREKARTFGCGTCHTIPGVRGADAMVGPPLTGMAGQMYIAGILTNTPEHMVKWIRDPPSVDSATAMPNVGASEKDARDIAAYLYTLSGSSREP